MTTPVGTHICINLETMRYAMIKFRLVLGFKLGVGFADTFRDNQRIALLVTHVFAI